MEYEQFGDVVEYDDNLNKTMRIKLMADVGGKTAYLDLKNRTGEDYQLHYIQFFMDDGYQETPLEQSPEEAKAFVVDILKKVGLGNWKVDSCAKI